MKNIMTLTLALLLGVGLQAQNTNVTNVTKKTVTTVKDSDGVKKTVKEQNIQAKQKIELENADSKTLNKNLKDSPVEMISTTTVTNPDGTTRTVAIDRSSAYQFNGNNYMLSLDPSGYIVTDVDNNKIGILRATTTNSYIFRGEKSISIGYFDVDGNMVLETYDDDSDTVTTRTFVRMQK
ncbi:hypothetical protein FLAN108750_07975 [Flavobacterium antarcticum]|uniref:hypothetical protein n=1 Tax=Flavobacterium antarcticum TaxID=271155 RepID=UPI0003B70DE1|nr:hypothetical protein [Flavobacterium antarcticum]